MCPLGGRVDGDRTLNQADPFRHTDEAEAAVAVGDTVEVETDSVVLHRQGHGIGLMGQCDHYFRRARMFHDIG